MDGWNDDIFGTKWVEKLTNKSVNELAQLRKAAELSCVAWKELSNVTERMHIIQKALSWSEEDSKLCELVQPLWQIPEEEPEILCSIISGVLDEMKLLKGLSEESKKELSNKPSRSIPIRINASGF